MNMLPRHAFSTFQRSIKLLSLPQQSSKYLSTQATAWASSSSETEDILLRCEDKVATITFNRPKKANAIGKEMLAQLRENVSMLSGEEGKDIRCVVLTSCSDKVFSAGADLKERSEMSKEEAASFVSSLRDCMDSLSTLPMPLIASVEVRQNK